MKRLRAGFDVQLSRWGGSFGGSLATWAYADMRCLGMLWGMNGVPDALDVETKFTI